MKKEQLINLILSLDILEVTAFTINYKDNSNKTDEKELNWTNV